MSKITLLFFALCVLINGDSTNDCSKYKDCASCVKSYRPLPGFQRYCGWQTSKSSCGEPLAIVAGSSVVVREPFMCPRSAPTAEKHRYTDTLGRTLYALTLAVRNSDPTECLANSLPDVQLIKRYEVECDQSRNLCAAMLAVSKRDKNIYVVYKSSNMDKQLITEFIHIVAAQLGVWEKFEGGGGVATYFHAAFERLFKGSGMKDDLIKLKKVYPGYEVWCTGHSLGASMSSMTALYLVKKKIFPAKLVRLVTFGEPRTGNVAFAQAVEENVKVRYRVVHRGDPLTNMPATINPIGLLISSTVAERQPYFYRYLIFYDNDMNEGSTFSVCTLSEDYACRNLALANNALDHTNYFAVNGDTYLSKGCKDTWE
uniref:Lipase_3 domain-containing protein n=1 Tax=Elaeophora elaphi TaxID=1147741 RepID=A0A0R3S123_9BILA